MKSMNMHQTILLALCSVLAAFGAATASAQSNINQDFDSLGGNPKLLSRAKALDPKNRISIVQKRAVDRKLRLETAVNYGLVAGGEPYVNTQNLGAMLDFHITPRWSVGARYAYSVNELTNEGKNMFEEARRQRAAGNLNYQVPSIDYPQQSVIGTLSWYPVYGKTNMFDVSIVHFDLYTLVGYGQMQLSSGWTDTITAGGGMGLWWTNYVSTRLEGRWQTYEDQTYSGARRLNLGTFMVSMGFLL